MWVNPEHHKVVGTVLADLRRSRNLKQTDVAAYLGKPQSFVSSYEAGQRRIDVLELLRISEALGMDAHDVFAEIVRKHREADL